MLRNNHLTELPPSLGGLLDLQWFSIADNNLDELPDWTASLVAGRSPSVVQNGSSPGAVALQSGDRA
jgi:Leucine-rich repeat (LRR) protein